MTGRGAPARAAGRRTRAAPRYDESVFVNCPFDREYAALFDAIVFAVHDCGFVARCALELQNSGQVRLARLLDLIAACRFGIHDLSRTELDAVHQLPRFNMPLELGLYLGAQHFGVGRHRDKVSLVLDVERYRYQKFISDIAGQDPAAHGGDPARAIAAVRDWLRDYSPAAIPGGAKIVERYSAFRRELPDICRAADLDPTALTFADYSGLVTAWLEAHNRPS